MSRNFNDFFANKSGHAVPISSSIYFAEGVPIDALIEGARFLRSGFIETDPTKFDGAIFNSSFLNEATNGTFGSGATIIYGIASSGTALVAVADGVAKRSTDGGQTWSTITIPGASQMFTVEHYNGIFMVGCTVNSAAHVATSADGLTWNVYPISGFSNQSVSAIAFNGTGRWVVGGFSGGRAYSDNNGATWTYSSSAGAGVTDISFGNGLFVHSKTGTDQVFRSADGINWLTSNISNGATAANAIHFWSELGLFVIAGSGAIYKSTDAITWEVALSGITNVMNDIHQLNGRMIVVGEGSKVYITSDAKTFTQLTPVTSATYHGIRIISDTSYVAVGEWANTPVVMMANVVNFAGNRTTNTQGASRQYVRIS